MKSCEHGGVEILMDDADRCPACKLQSKLDDVEIELEDNDYLQQKVDADKKVCSFCGQRFNWPDLLAHYDECVVLHENRWSMYPWEYLGTDEKQYRERAAKWAL